MYAVIENNGSFYIIEYMEERLLVDDIVKITGTYNACHKYLFGK